MEGVEGVEGLEGVEVEPGHCGVRGRLWQLQRRAVQRQTQNRNLAVRGSSTELHPPEPGHLVALIHTLERRVHQETGKQS